MGEVLTCACSFCKRTVFQVDLLLPGPEPGQALCDDCAMAYSSMAIDLLPAKYEGADE